MSTVTFREAAYSPLLCPDLTLFQIASRPCIAIFSFVNHPGVEPDMGHKTVVVVGFEPTSSLGVNYSP